MNQEIVYLYDNSFEGFLTCIYRAYYSRENPSYIITKEEQIDFLVKTIEVDTDLEKSKKVYKAIQEKISEDALIKVFTVFLSEEKDMGTIILNYLRVAFKMGAQIDDYNIHPVVIEIDKIYKRVGIEKHRLLGLTRFKELQNGIFYAQLEPVYNVVSLLAPHFSTRLNNERWIIHDIKRGIAVFYNKKEWVIRNIDEPENFIISEAEEGYQDMWREYYKHIAIGNRKNTRQKKAYMPTRYWKHLVELY
ncbi:MAG: TIGR03915 family putative DNA repair protein [Gudongella sp.]|nr:TIGR03915 family putative DNA repair protein [Gudongella sp.]